MSIERDDNLNNLVVTMFTNRDIFIYGIKNFKVLSPENIEEAIEDAYLACWNDFSMRFSLLHTGISLKSVAKMSAFTNGIPVGVNMLIDLEEHKL